MSSLDPVILNAVMQSGTSIVTRLEPVQFSRTVTAQFDGWVKFRAMGAGGGGARSNGARGGNGGTVATTAWQKIKAGDQFVITVPSGGATGPSSTTPGAPGGTLTVVQGGTTLLTIPGGNGGSNFVAPTKNALPGGSALAWYVLGGLGGDGVNSGGGGAMIVEGGTVAGRGGNADSSGGGGAMGNGGDLTSSGGGSATQNATSTGGAQGWLASEMCVLRFTNSAAQMNGGGVGSIAGGFGAGGAYNGLGGFGGGGGGNAAGGFGGGGGGGSNQGGGGAGGQGFVTVEWREIVK